MATFVFWNLKRQKLYSEIRFLCDEHDVDILILAESSLNSYHLLKRLNHGRSRLYLRPPNLSSKLEFFIRYASNSFQSVSDEGGIAIRRILPPVGADFLLCALHLPSKMVYTEIDQFSHALRAVEAIRAAETSFGHSRTVLVGDLNMNPFEPACINFEVFHGVMDRRIAAKGDRTVQGVTRKYFYNPMWSRMGDFSLGPPGTYFYGSSTPTAYFWNTFDQVLIRPELLNVFPDSELKVLTTCNGQSLLKPSGIPDHIGASDHLPLKFNLDIERILANAI